ncbi:MAG: hypothetical protein H0X17_23850, partial [Deltaproteobacteria bacterium]|nr:hypothetical protein [Deltaproteobacteria bacterium]
MRLHEKTLTALAHGDDPIELASPAPGRFRIGVALGDTVRPGSLLGELDVLGQLSRVIAPATVRGAVIAICDPSLARPAVEFGAMLVRLDPHAAVGASAGVTTTSTPLATTGLVFRAPTSGRCYGRAAPDKPAFVTVGDELATGATVCLLEVMKTFHRVTYGGAELPERVRVTQLLVADGADVNAGDPLLAL